MITILLYLFLIVIAYLLVGIGFLFLSRLFIADEATVEDVIVVVLRWPAIILDYLFNWESDLRQWMRTTVVFKDRHPPLS